MLDKKKIQKELDKCNDDELLCVYKNIDLMLTVRRSDCMSIFSPSTDSKTKEKMI